MLSVNLYSTNEHKTSMEIITMENTRLMHKVIFFINNPLYYIYIHIYNQYDTFIFYFICSIIVNLHCYCKSISRINSDVPLAVPLPKVKKRLSHANSKPLN